MSPVVRGENKKTVVVEIQARTALCSFINLSYLEK